MYLSIDELSRDQIVELKQNYMAELVNEGTFAEVIGRDYDEPSYWDLANADDIVPDDVIWENYGHISFVPDDFFCSCGN